MRRRQTRRAIRGLGHGAAVDGYGQTVYVCVGDPRVPLGTQISRSRWLLWGDLIGSGKGFALDDGDDLVFGPSVFMIVETLPERCQSTFDLD